MRTLPSLLALVVLVGCDTRSDDELRAMMGDVADGHVASVKERQAELAKADEAVQSQLAALSQRVTELETQLAASQARVDELLARPEPTPTPTPTPPTAGRPDPAATYRVEIADAQTKGLDTALVTVVVYSDFQCPYCARVNPTLAEVAKHFGSDVRFAFKHNPLSFHTRALPAAIAAEAAGEQGKFWEMHDKLFDNSKDLTDANFVVWAKELKLDVKKFEAALKDPAIERRVKNHQTAGTTLGARGTPSFFINGRFLSGAQPFESFRALIEEERKQAEALVAGGTPRTGVYDAVIATGKTSV